MRLTETARDILIEHLNGPVAFVAVLPTARRVSLQSMLRQRYLTTDRATHPLWTEITRSGRELLAEALADWAAALVRAGYLTSESVIPDSTISSEAIAETPVNPQ